MEKMTGKETVKNMEHLVKLLHKEWERSGRTKAEVSIEITDKKEVGAKLTAEIQERQKQLEMTGMDFKDCMALSRENFVLLRLARKIKKAGDKAGRREIMPIRRGSTRCIPKRGKAGAQRTITTP